MKKYPKLACLADTTPKAQSAFKELSKHYDFIDITRKKTKVDAAVVLGGDGFMLTAIHKFMGRHIPVYGMNCGTVGFLMNRYSPEYLEERLGRAIPTSLYPLRMFAKTLNGKLHELLAVNEVSLLRESKQAARIRVTVDHVVRIDEMVCDGVMVATPAGSTAYNFSAGGPVLPLSANLLTITPISPFRPRRWKGALLPHNSSVYFEVLDPKKRPVSVVADFNEVRDVVSVSISEHRDTGFTLLFDPEHNLEERMIKEQFEN